MDYEILFNLDKFNSAEILNETVKFDCDFFKINKDDVSNDLNEENKISENSIYLKNNGGFVVELEKDIDYITINDIIPDSLIDMVRINLKDDNTPLINSTFSTLPIRWNAFFKNISFYDFNPIFSKYGGVKNNDGNLSEFGENLAYVLEQIINDSDKRERFLNLLISVLPYIEDVGVDKLLDNRKLFTILEKYTDVVVPSHLVSDGTSNVIALIVALYFQDNSCILIEEPERNIHPQLISDVVQMMKEISKDKQIFITTHNPELLKHIDLEDIYFISRDENGYSNMIKPVQNDFLKSFIDELGIDEVFVDNYLEL